MSGFPSPLKFGGDDKFLATFVVKLDADDKGRLSNVRVLSAALNAVAAASFAEKFLTDWTLKRTGWETT